MINFKAKLIGWSFALSLFAVEGWSLSRTHGDFFGIPPKEEVYQDTTPPKYQYFYKAQIGIAEWNMAADTLDKILPHIGESMTVDQANYYKQLFVRQLRKLQFSVDSIKLEKPKK